MNKKFLSAVLFGALMVTSTGTFVSCKDYDDDIDQINQELTSIKSAIDALQTKVDGGKYVTNVVKNGDGITVTWNDNSTSTIETIKGDKGDKTIVTVIEGYWAFDGVKSEYPATPEAGEAGVNGHDAKISEDGYWMVWDAEKGEYKKTEYIAGGATAVAGDHGWPIIVRDQNGKEQSIYIPNSADLVSIQDAKDYVDEKGDGIDIFYGLVKTPVDWDGAKAVNGKMEAGMYPVLSQDVMIMLNPTGVDGTAYKFDFRDSDNKEPWGLKFGDLQPYAGSKLTRAASASGVWVLPRAIDRVPLNELDERADYVTQFKNNYDEAYIFALNATSKEDASKVIKSQYIYSFDPTNVGNLDAKDFVYNAGLDKYSYVWNIEHAPNFDADATTLGLNGQQVTLSQVIYDYKLEIDKTKMTQVLIDKYGLEITKDGYRFIAKKEAAVDNYIDLKMTYILVNGSKHTKDLRVRVVAKDIVVTDNNIGTLDKAFNAAQLGTVAAGTNATQIAALDNKFVYTDKLTFDLKEKLGANYDEWIDAMYQKLSNSWWTDADRASFLQDQASIVGGDPINNDATYNEALIDNLVYFDYVDATGKSCIYGVNANERLARLAEIAALKVHFIAGACYDNGTTWVVDQKAVETPYYTENGTQNWGRTNAFAIPLNNAFSVQLLAQKEDQPVAALNFKFQLTQPEIDKVGILPMKSAEFTQWKDDTDGNGNKIGDALYSFGAYDASVMKLPLYEAFDMWYAANGTTFALQNANAQYYSLSSSNAVNGVTLINQAVPTLVDVLLSNNTYFGNWTQYITSATNNAGDMLNDAVIASPQQEADIYVDVEYNFFGVYPALPAQLPFYSTGSGNLYREHPGFRLVFASTIQKSKIKTSEDLLKAAAGTHHVFISNDNVECTTMLNGSFVLFDGLDANGNATSRKDLNDLRGFNEDIRNYDIDWANVSAKYVADGSSITNISGPATTTKFDRTVATDWVITAATGDIKLDFNTTPRTAPVDGIAIYEVDAREAEGTSATNLVGVKAHQGGYAIQLGANIDYRQQIEVTIPVKDKLGFVKNLTFKVQKLQ